MSNEASKPVVINCPVQGPAKKLEYFFPGLDGGENHHGFINLINGNPPEILVVRDSKVIVEEAVDPKK